MNPTHELRRGLTLPGAIAVNVANMIGTGVFLKSRVMTCNVGDAGLVLFVWLAAGLLALAGTFVYSELAAMMPEAGGDYVYVRRGFGPLAGFLNGWINNFGRAASQAALAAGLAIFANVAFGGALERFTIGVPGVAWLSVSGLALAALATIVAVTWLNCASIEGSGGTALALTTAKVALVGGVAAVAFLGGGGDFAHLAMSGAAGTCEGVEPSARGGLAGFGAAMLGALWAYDGWSNVAPLIGELKDPQRNAPRAFIGGTVLVGALYLVANLGYFYVLTPIEVASVAQTSSVATVVLARYLGPAAVTLMAACLMVSSFGAAHSSQLAGGRVSYAMARDGLFFSAFRRLSARGVPVRAVIAQGAFAGVLVLAGRYDTLTDAAMFAYWTFYGLTGVTLFVLRRREPDAARGYRAFGYPVVPALFVGVTLAMLANTFVATPHQALQSVGMLLCGLPFYAYWTRRLPGSAGP